MGSEPLKLSLHDVSKVIKGAGIALAGALLTYLSGLVTSIDFGQYTPVVVAVWSVIFNVAQKFLTDTRE